MQLQTRNSDYWQRQFEALEDIKYKETLAKLEVIDKFIDEALATIIREIELYYLRYKPVSLLGSRKALTDSELKELKQDLREAQSLVVAEALYSDFEKALDKMYDRVRVTRLQGLVARVETAVALMYMNEREELDEHLEAMYLLGFLRTAYAIQKGVSVGFPVAVPKLEDIDKVLDKPWTADKVNYSHRIWDYYRPELVLWLSQKIKVAMVNGEEPEKLIADITDRFNKLKSQAGNIAQTETAVFYSRGQEKTYDYFGLGWYEIVATLDRRTSKICRSLDGKVFPLSEYQVWVTAPPFHNYCRTVTAPYIPDDVESSMRIYRTDDNKRGYVPATMSYEEWYKKYTKE